jgi:hypothetical protein
MSNKGDKGTLLYAICLFNVRYYNVKYSFLCTQLFQKVMSRPFKINVGYLQQDSLFQSKCRLF